MESIPCPESLNTISTCIQLPFSPWNQTFEEERWISSWEWNPLWNTTWMTSDTTFGVEWSTLCKTAKPVVQLQTTVQQMTTDLRLLVYHTLVIWVILYSIRQLLLKALSDTYWMELTFGYDADHIITRSEVISVIQNKRKRAKRIVLGVIVLLCVFSFASWIV